MTSRLDTALSLAAEGFYIFPIRANDKRPAHKGWQEEATRDPATIKEWFSRRLFNIGIYTGKFGDDEALLVVDVDRKKGKDGYASLIDLQFDGLEFPETRETLTASGGKHIYFRVDAPVRQGADKLGEGLDIRSRGGYVVGPSSTVPDGDYTCSSSAGVAPAPGWLTAKLGGGSDTHDRRENPPEVQAPTPSARTRTVGYLRDTAPLALEGAAGDETTYKVAAHCKDLGCDQALTFELMSEYWNDRCQPPWSADDLYEKISNAFKYGVKDQGVDAPENIFPDSPAENSETFDADDAEKVLNPFDKLNKEYAFVLAGGGDHILWQTTDAKGNALLIHLNTGSFHRKFAAHKMQAGKRAAPVTEEWMEWKGRRSYDGIVFMPQQKAPERFFNLWSGFAITPSSTGPAEAHGALSALLEHIEQNVCAGDAKLYRWLMGYFAHIVQRPWEKPLVALVFRGSKGVGKNVVANQIGSLLGAHYLLTANRRYLVGNFNGHLENCLMFVLDEAFWSGDKQAEGTLKDLITGRQHVIEHKGKESYPIDNLTRVVIIGNEDWVIPASHDERRFAVFEVGDGRKQDKQFFAAMDQGMRAGGSRLLLDYLLKFDLTGIDVNDAPPTKGLLRQKHEGLEPFPQWWLACLLEERIVMSDIGDEWPEAVECERLRHAFGRWSKEQNIRSRLPDSKKIGRLLRQMAPSVKHGRKGTGYVYELPAIERVREDWKKHIGQSVEWSEV